MTSKNIISETQFGFRKLHSTSHGIHHSLNFIKKSHSNSNHVIAIFIDLSKAFDTIDHRTLLCKLYNYGIRGTPHDLIKSYVSRLQDGRAWDGRALISIVLHGDFFQDKTPRAHTFKVSKISKILIIGY